MDRIVMGTRRKLSHKPHLLKGMHRLRHQVFHEKLGWQVQSVNGQESDYFDALNPTYILAADHDNSVEGTWRLLPTFGPYMLKDVFPQLLRGEKPPKSRNIWEISRFAVSPRNLQTSRQAVFSRVSLEMMRAAYQFAVAEGISHYVFATSVSLERMFRALGVPVHRFGDQQAQYIGKVLSVGCWIDINEQLRQSLFDTALPSARISGAA